MAKYRALITDVTEYGDLRCVAGVNLADESMIRPEPAPAKFWPGDSCAPKGPFAPGNVVVFEAENPDPATDFPHMTEDRVVQGKAAVEKTVDPAKFAAALGRLHTPLGVIFGKHVVFSNGKPYIKTGTKCPSLYGTNVEPSAIAFREYKYNEKARPRLTLKAETVIADLSITDHDLRKLYRSKSIDALAARFKKAKELHLRLGLARGFGDYPDRCYMQVNGIYVLK